MSLPSCGRFSRYLAIIFLYKQVLHIEVNDKIAPIWAKRRPRLPVVMSVDETRAVLNRMQGQHLLMAELLYGAGLRLMECIRLRVNSIDIEGGMIYVRFGKGGKDHGLPLPKTLAEKLKTQLETVRGMYTADLAEGFGEEWLPEGFARKMGPGVRDHLLQGDGVKGVEEGTTFLRNSMMPGRGKSFKLNLLYIPEPRIREDPIISPIVHIGVSEIEKGKPEIHGQCFCKGERQPPGDGRDTDDDEPRFK